MIHISSIFKPRGKKICILIFYKIQFKISFYLFGAISLKQGEGRSESRCKVCDLHCLNLVDGLGELGDILGGRLNQLWFTVRVGEALHEGLRLVGEGEHSDEVVLAQSLHDVQHHVLGDLFPQAGHRPRHIKQDDNVLVR